MRRSSANISRRCRSSAIISRIASADPKYISVALGVQVVGLQYNDDLNVNFIPPPLAEAGYDDTLGPGLPGYATVNLTTSREIGRNVQVFFGVQNLFDQVYFVQTNPSTTGTPRLVNGGVRLGGLQGSEVTFRNTIAAAWVVCALRAQACRNSRNTRAGVVSDNSVVILWTPTRHGSSSSTCHQSAGGAEQVLGHSLA